MTKTDAKGNTTTEASAKLSDQDVKEAQEKGEAVTVPVKGIAAAKDANAATKIKIDVPNNANKTTVEIPVENVTSGTVAVIVHEDGTEELVKDSKPTEHGVQLELSGSTTVKIIDNSKTFDDTKDHWSRDEVNFVAARDLFNGVGGNQFGVSQPMTRGMVNTVLARLADVDTTPGQGQAWYEVGTDWAKKNGISDGTNPTAPVTREQLATLLYRYAGSPSVSGTLHAADAASVSDYAEDALLWANQNGIVNGVGSNTIAPKDNAQRAQVAAMLARYLQNQPPPPPLSNKPRRRPPIWGRPLLDFVITIRSRKPLDQDHLARYRKVTICPRVQSLMGLNVVSLVPVVIFCCTAHWTALA